MKIRGNQKTDMPENLQPASSSEPEDSNCGNQSNNVDVALDNFETMKIQSDVNDIKQSTTSLQEKMSCQFGKLDSLLNKAENAQYSMSHQNQQMRKFLKWRHFTMTHKLTQTFNIANNL